VHLTEEKCSIRAYTSGQRRADDTVTLIDDEQDEPDDPYGYFTLREVVRRHLGVEIAKTEQRSDWEPRL